MLTGPRTRDVTGRVTQALRLWPAGAQTRSSVTAARAGATSVMAVLSLRYFAELTPWGCRELNRYIRRYVPEVAYLPYCISVIVIVLTLRV